MTAVGKTTKAKNKKKTVSAAQKKTAGRTGKSSARTGKNSAGTGKSSGAAGKNARKTIEEVNAYQDRIAFEMGITLIVLGMIAVVCYLSYFGLAGKAGVVLGGLLFGVFGWIAWILPAGLMVAFVFSLVNREDRRVPRKIISFSGMMISLAAITDLLTETKVLTEYYADNHVLHKGYMECMYLSFQDTIASGQGSGGILGRAVSNGLSAVLGKVGTGALLAALFLLCLYIFYGIELMVMLRRRNAYHQEMKEAYEVIQEQPDYKKPSYQVMHGNGRRKIHTDRMMKSVDLQQMNERLDQQLQEKENRTQALNSSGQEKETKKTVEKIPDQEEILPNSTSEEKMEIPIYREEMQQKFGEPKEASEPKKSSGLKKGVSEIKKNSGLKKEVAAEQKATELPMKKGEPERTVKSKKSTPYVTPPLELLSVPKEVQGRVSDAELRITASKLQDTLKSFNVNVTMGAVTCGPTVTRYELLPEQGVRVNKITNLADDLKLSLAAASIRIEAPIPGKAAVGIEVPNPVPSPVYFRELLDGDTFQKAKSPVTFAVGKDIAGKLILTDIAKMPHLLIAGATGSGKSVCINTLIMSILYKSNPDDVKLIMIDPKVVELSVYNGIPHLFCPVVTDPKEAAAALNWAVREMMERYNKFKELGVRNISGYNQKIQTVEEPEKAGYAKMPSLVIIVDEFADLMMVASKEVEDAVCRLAQLARAAGIHLVLATQRPSVNVITGVIKANIPSRIAFSVSSAIDSRTILDKGGAEKLLGKGDMLFFPSGYSEPVRVQGAFISDKEVSEVVDFLRETNEQPEYNHKVTEIVETPQEQEADKSEEKPDQDEYFAEAGRFVIESDRAAAGQLQRRFSIGFNRAGRIIDQLHKAGVVGPAEGTKPRKVLMTMEEFELMFNGGTPVSEEEFDAVAQEFEQEASATVLPEENEME